MKRIFSIPFVLIGQVSTKKISYVGGLLFIFNLLIFIGNPNCSMLESAFSTFDGYGYGYVNVTEYLKFIIFALTPIYFFSCIISKNNISQLNGIIIRLRKKCNWLFLTQLSFIIILLSYFLIYFLTLFLASALMGRLSVSLPSSTDAFQNYLCPAQVIPLILISIVLRLFESLSIQMVLMLLSSLTKNLSLSFMIIFTLYLPLLAIKSDCYPLGVSSIQRFISKDPLEGFFLIILFIAIYISCYIIVAKWSLAKLFE